MAISLPPRRDDVLAMLRADAQHLLAFGVRALFLFGSVARDEARTDSDIDLLVDFAGSPTYRGYMGLKFHLEDMLGCRVDLVTRNGLRSRVLPAVEREAIRVA